MEKPSDKLFIPADWKKWIAENVILGNCPDDLIRILVEKGFPAELASLEIDAAACHPYIEAARSLSRKLKKRDWVLNVERILQNEDEFDVERRNDLSIEEFFHEYYFKNRPLILLDALKHWKALEAWTPDYLADKCGDRNIEIQANRNADPRYEIDTDAHRQIVQFADFVSMVFTGGETNDYYMTANNSDVNGKALRELWDDLDMLPDYLDPARSENMFFWMGPAGTVTPVHHDLTNNFMAQVTGRKQIKLISPWHLPILYNHHHCYSQVDLDNIDYDQYPMFRDARIHEITLNQGELFFLPVGWWHHVRGLDPTITVTATNFRARNDFGESYETFGPI